MGGISQSVKNLAAGGGLIALVAIAGCGRSDAARADDMPTDTLPTTAASAPPDPGRGRGAGASAVAIANVTSAVTGDTLCTAGETPFFSCAIGGKRVSVCRSGAGAVYRYGTPGKVEMTTRNVTFANRGYSGGGESQLIAASADYTYTVYDRTVRTRFDGGGNDPEFSSGLIVARGGRTLSAKTCAGEATIDADARRVLPAGTFVAH